MFVSSYRSAVSVLVVAMNNMALFNTHEEAAEHTAKKTTAMKCNIHRKQSCDLQEQPSTHGRHAPHHQTQMRSFKHRNHNSALDVCSVILCSV